MHVTTRALGAMLLAMCALGAAPQAQAPADLKPGDLAPNWKLQASDGKTYQLSDFRNKQAVVLAWFPKAFTAG